tara:strand:+ start:105 stop:263 length:159 start_codon:yes stop_codon:yes gene_type:complete
MAEAKKKSAPGNITVMEVEEDIGFSWDGLTQREMEEEMQKRAEAKKKESAGK